MFNVYETLVHFNDCLLPVMTGAGMASGGTGHGRSRRVGTVPVSALGHHELCNKVMALFYTSIAQLLYGLI